MSDMNELLQEYWTKTKCGKHNPKDLIMEHGLRLKTYAIVDVEDIMEQIKKNDYSIDSMPRTSWSKFLKEAKLDDYLKPEYVQSALDVQLGRPAIGVGEFLFVSCFGNLAFASESGDLIDTKRKKRIEFKGNRSTFSGDAENVQYLEMNKGILSTISAQFAEYKSVENGSSFNREFCKVIDDKLKDYPDKIEMIISLCQNVSVKGKPSNKLTEMFSTLYRDKGDLFYVVAAMHCYAYLTAQKADYLMMANDKGYMCCETPKDALDAWKIVRNLNVTSWAIGKKGFSVSL